MSGSAEICEAVFAFDSSWDGFARTAVFECAGERREQLLVNDRCIVPWEILHAGAYLCVGVYGVNGNQTMPTVYSGTMFVAQGAEPSEAAREHSADMFDQIVEIGQQATMDAESAGESAQAAAASAQDASEDAAYIREIVEGGIVRTVNHIAPNADGNVDVSGGGASSWSNLTDKPFDTIGENLKVVGGALTVDTATNVQQDNTKPITSAAVFAEVGNIHALLALI